MGKRKESRKSIRRNKRMANSNIISMTDHTNIPQRYRKKKVDVVPRSQHQEDYLFAIEDNTITFGVGPAGTGKTLLATTLAIKELRIGNIDKIIITRPTVSVDEDLGFLPGTLIEKMAPWVRPLIDIFEEYYSPVQIERMIEDGVIEIAPLAMMRGRTFKNSWIILDESQNLTISQAKMCLTRIGQESKMIITGDLAQHDRGFEENGLRDLLKRIKDTPMPSIKVIYFTRDDVERSEIVSSVLSLYGDN